MTMRDKPSEWKDYVAAYQSMYSDNTLATIAQTTAETDLNLASLGGVPDHDINHSQTDEALQFKRGQVLGYQGRPLVQLAYLNAMGEPIALYMIRAESVSPSAVELTKKAADRMVEQR